jgi:hypothetical protein
MLNCKLQDYFQENIMPDFAKWFEDGKWLEEPVYLADILYHRDQKNKSLQGSRENDLPTNDEILGHRRR